MIHLSHCGNIPVYDVGGLVISLNVMFQPFLTASKPHYPLSIGIYFKLKYFCLCNFEITIYAITLILTRELQIKVNVIVTKPIVLMLELNAKPLIAPQSTDSSLPVRRDTLIACRRVISVSTCYFENNKFHQICKISKR